MGGEYRQARGRPRKKAARPYVPSRCHTPPIEIGKALVQAI